MPACSPHRLHNCPAPQCQPGAGIPESRARANALIAGSTFVPVGTPPRSEREPGHEVHHAPAANDDALGLGLSLGLAIDMLDE